jgi:protein-tyrosine phosphatase
MTEIFNNLYVASIEEAFDENIIKNVKSILNVASDLNIPERAEHNYLWCGIEDDTSTDNMLYIVEPCLEFIHKNIDKGVLIHCLEGKSRSVCIAILYLKLYQKINIDDSICLLKTKRNIDIYPLYLEQIKDFILFNGSRYEVRLKIV